MVATKMNVIPQPTDESQFHLYLAWACPFCHRVAATLALTGLKSKVSYTWVKNIKHDAGWEIEPAEEPLFGANLLSKIYTQFESMVNHGPSVPLLVDLSSNKMLSSSSSEITRYFACGMAGKYDVCRELSPANLITQINAMNSWLHEHVNRAVYRVGFATDQTDYENQVRNLFNSLEELELRLGTQTNLIGENLTESDLYLLATLERFDSVYYSLFKCSYRRIGDYVALSNYHIRLRTIGGVAETYKHGLTKEHYFRSVMHVNGETRVLNPSGLVPVDPFTLSSV